MEDVWRRAGVSPSILTRLAEADVFASLGLSRRQALWGAKAIKSDKPLPLFAEDMDGEAIFEPEANLPEMTLGEQVVEDYVATRLSLKAHPVALLRHKLTPIQSESDGQPSQRPVIKPNHGQESQNRPELQNERREPAGKG